MSRRTKKGVKATDALIAGYAHQHLHPESVKTATFHFAGYCKGLPPAEQARLSGDRKSLGKLADSWFSKNAPSLPGISRRDDAEEKRPSLSKAQDASQPDFGLRERRS